MKNRGRLALIVAFFAGLLGLWWAESHVRDRNAGFASEGRVLASIYDVKPDDVRRLEIDGGAHRIAFERRPGNRWQIVEPIDAAADPSLVETLAANLKLLERARDSGTIVDDPARYGLSPPSRTVRLFGADGSKPLATLDVGGFAPNRDRRYVHPEGAVGVDVVEAKALAAVELPTDRWRDRLLVRMPTFQVKALAATRADGGSLRVERSGDLWEIVEPFRAVADSDRVDGLLAEVGGLRVPDGGFVADDVRDLAPFGLDKPSVSVTLTPRASGASPQTVHIGKPAPRPEGDRAQAKGVRYYARRDDQDDVVLVDAGLLKDLGLHPAELHAKKVADVAPDRVDAIRLTSEGSAVTVARRPKGWMRIAPLADKADDAAVAGLLKKVDEAEASLLLDPKSASDPQLDKPWATLELWRDSGPRPGEGPDAPPTTASRLKLELGRRDPIARTVYARVAGDPLIMALPSTFLDGLTFGAFAFRDRQVAAVSPPEIERIAIVQGPKTSVIEPPPKGGDPTAWRLKGPADAPADPESVGRLLLALSNLRAETLVTDRPGSDAAFGLDKPAIVAKWKLRDQYAPPPRRTVPGEESTLTIGSEVPHKPGPRYARLSSSPIVFTLAPEVVALFDAEWRDRRVAEFDPKRARSVALRWPALTLKAVAKGADPDWSLVGAPTGLKFDPSRLKPMIESLSRLSTFRYAQYTGPIPTEWGLFPPRLAIEVDPGDGRPPIVLRLGRRSTEGYLLATTEGGPFGVAFLLPLGAWEPWIKPPAIEPDPPKEARPK